MRAAGTTERTSSRRGGVAADGPHAGEDIQLRLLRNFELTADGAPVPLPMSVQRLVAFLAIQERRLSRPYVAGSLWVDVSEERAAASLRSALWRLKPLGGRLVRTTAATLELAPSVQVDIRELSVRARQLLAEDADSPETDLDQSLYCVDLLPDWYDDWLVIERERFHQLRLRALELICERLTASGRFVRALEAGLAAVAGEPLRESAHRALVGVHLAEGNRAEAVRQFELYRKLLDEQLGLNPSSQMIALIRSVAPVHDR